MKIAIIKQSEDQDDVPFLLIKEHFSCTIKIINKGFELEYYLSNFVPDIIIIDLRTFQNIDLKEIDSIKKISSAPLALYLSEADIETISSAYCAGIQGFIIQEKTNSSLIEAVQALSLQDFYMDNRISQILLNEIQDKKNIVLTPRETDILDCIKKRMTNKEIAEKLGISENTVKSHIKNIFKKKSTSKRGELMESLSL